MSACHADDSDSNSDLGVHFICIFKYFFDIFYRKVYINGIIVFFYREGMIIRLIYLTIVTIFLLGLCGAATADVLTPNVPETHGFSVQTQMDLVGTASHQDEVVWRMSSEILDSNEEQTLNFFVLAEGGNGNWDFDPVNEIFVPNPGHGQYNSEPFPDIPPGVMVSYTTPEPPLNSLGEVQMSDAYRENTIADQGEITYTKTMGIETGYQPQGLQNLETTRILTFQGSDMGRAISEEEVTLDTAGTAIVLQGFDPYVCPFAHSLGNCSPPFCNIVQSGSSVDMTLMSLASEMGARTVGVQAYGPDEAMGTWPPIPRVDTAPVEMDYRLRVTGINPGSPALGSISAYLKVHVQDGGKGCPVRTGKAQDILYSEKTTAEGNITLFDKAMHYESGLRTITL
jgi:hypothetical protein